MKTAFTLKRRLIDAVTMFLVSGLSLVLLIYVGFSEAQRTFQQFQVEKLEAQGIIVQNAIESFVRAGLPLKQYVGFTTLAEPILDSDDTIVAMVVFDQAGRAVFAAGDGSIPLLPMAAAGGGGTLDVRLADEHQQVVLPLRNRFETVGSLAITMPQSIVTQRVETTFTPLLLVAGALSLAFAIFVSISGPQLAGRRTPWLQVAFALTFIAMAVTVIGTLIALYSDGAQTKSKALADSLGNRLSDIVAFNLNIGQIDGLDTTFGDYRRLYPDISAAGLTVDGIVRIHTDPAAVGRPWISDSANYEYVVDLTQPGGGRTIKVAVALPADIVVRRVLRSVKNFAALFVASAFLAGLFLQLAGPMQRQAAGEAIAAQGKGDEALLSLVKPVFFVAVFVEHLNYAFLPQFMHQVVAASGLSAGYASGLFTAYFLCFALTLIPAGQFAQSWGPRPLVYGGLALAAAGVFMLTLPMDFYIVMVARCLSGIGQGMLFIGVQSYILAMAAPGGKTRGAAIIVFGFQGGMISGMAIGSLLVTYMGPSGVFMLGGIIAISMAIYAVFIVPATPRRAMAETGFGANLRQLGRDLGQVLRNLRFMETMFLIGIPAKAVLTGVIIFALPLILAQKHYPQEDIGQIVMIYAASVVIASSYVSRLVDRIGKTDIILFWGTAISGVGLLLISLIGSDPIDAGGPDGTFMVTAVLIFGVAMVGVAHGFINAPVVTHVAESELATRIGVPSVTATYRFLERIGHIAGPVIIGQLFLFAGLDAANLIWVGGAIAALGFLFLMRATPQYARTA